MASAKMAELKKTVGSNVAESIGATRGKPKPAAKVIRGVSPPDPLARLRGLNQMPEAALIALDRIIPDPDQPRKDFDELALCRLIDSLVERGQLLPIRVRYSAELDKYLIICGERRYRAAVRLKWPSIRCVIHAGEIEPEELLIDQLTENCVREDLSPIEQAHGFRKVMAATEMSGRELAKNLGISQASVSRALALLDQPQPVQDLVDSGQLAASTALEIAKVADPEAQVAIAGQVVAGSMNRSQVREVIHGVSSKIADRKTSSKLEPAPWRKVPTTAVGFPGDLRDKLLGDNVATAGQAWDLVEKAYLVDVYEFSVHEAKLIEGYLVALREEAGDPAPCTLATPDPDLKVPDEPWRSRHLTEDAELSYKALEAARKKGIETFGELESRLRECPPKSYFNGQTPDLRSALGRAKLTAEVKSAIGGANASPPADGGRGVPGRPAPAPPRPKEVDPTSELPPWKQAAYSDRMERVLASVEGVEIVARSGAEAYSMRVLVALNDAVARVRMELGLGVTS